MEKKLDANQEAELRERFALAEISFKTVLDADVHEDNKASRVLTGMAFLTAAAAAIFTKAYTPGPSQGDLESKLPQTLSAYVSQNNLAVAVDKVLQLTQRQPLNILGADPALFAFTAYMLFVVIGTMLYLAAIGPSLNIPDWFKHGSDKAKSLLFFESISKLSSNVWEEHWRTQTTAELRSQMRDNYVQETRLIAEKAAAKFAWMRWGTFSFKVALGFLLVLVADLLSPDPTIVRSAIFCYASVWLALFAFERFRRPPIESPSVETRSAESLKESIRDVIANWRLWAALAVLCFITSVLMLLRLVWVS